MKFPTLASALVISGFMIAPALATPPAPSLSIGLPAQVNATLTLNHIYATSIQQENTGNLGISGLKLNVVASPFIGYSSVTQINDGSTPLAINFLGAVDLVHSSVVQYNSVTPLPSSGN